MKRAAAILIGPAAGLPSHGAIALVAQTSKALGYNGGTTPAIDSKGGDLGIIVVRRSTLGTPTVSDNKGGPRQSFCDSRLRQPWPQRVLSVQRGAERHAAVVCVRGLSTKWISRSRGPRRDRRNDRCLFAKSCFRHDGRSESHVRESEYIGVAEPERSVTSYTTREFAAGKLRTPIRQSCISTRIHGLM